jgi:hypothetical protein
MTANVVFRIPFGAEGTVELFSGKDCLYCNFRHAYRASDDAERLRYEGGVAGFQGIGQEGRDFLVIDESDSAIVFRQFLSQGGRPTPLLLSLPLRGERSSEGPGPG